MIPCLHVGFGRGIDDFGWLERNGSEERWRKKRE